MISYRRMTEQLQELSQLVNQLTAAQYTETIPVLGHVSIGQHVRHIIEVVQCAVTGYASGYIDYENRKRDLRIENDRQVAMACIAAVLENMEQPDKQMQLFAGENNDASTTVSTYYSREIVYNLEHTIHHMALIKVALRSLQLELTTEQFGVGYSTMAYKQEVCAQ